MRLTSRFRLTGLKAPSYASSLDPPDSAAAIYPIWSRRGLASRGLVGSAAWPSSPQEHVHEKPCQEDRDHDEHERREREAGARGVPTAARAASHRVREARQAGDPGGALPSSESERCHWRRCHRSCRSCRLPALPRTRSTAKKKRSPSRRRPHCPRRRGAASSGGRRGCTARPRPDRTNWMLRLASRRWPGPVRARLPFSQALDSPVNIAIILATSLGPEGSS